jgi:hypothetical protein
MVVFGRPLSTWEPIWHWLEPSLLLAACILWGWLLFALVERPAAAYLRGLMAGKSRGIAPA